MSDCEERAIIFLRPLSWWARGANTLAGVLRARPSGTMGTMRAKLYSGLVGMSLMAWGALSVYQNHWMGLAKPQAIKSKRLELAKTREGDAFRLRLRSGQSERFTPPGLRAAYLSWKWLELLQATHQAESYEGDFSWFFSSLDYIAENAHESEIMTLTGLGAFFFVIGRDHSGANLFVDRLVARASERYNPNFWSGFHALENLQSNLMAAYFFDRAYRANGPVYLKHLSERLSDQVVNADEKIEGIQLLPEPLRDIVTKKKARTPVRVSGPFNETD